jgi:hypothetical protein
VKTRDSEHESSRLSRRQFLQATALSAMSIPGLDRLDPGRLFMEKSDRRSPVFRVDGCPVHDGQLRHVGVDAMLYLLAEHGTRLYRSGVSDALSAPDGLIAPDDVVILKVNAQWKCRGGTNTDLLRGLIHRILQHPEGFGGEIVIFENGQGRPAAFDGIHSDAKMEEYQPFPELIGKTVVNAEQQDVTTIEYLVNTVFAGKPVSSFLMDPHSDTWIAMDDHKTHGYRRVGERGTACISYPCFTTARGNRIELREGRWTGAGYAQNVKLIHCAVLKDHSGDIGMTGALKIVYGTLSMRDGTAARRHYEDLGSQCARMWTEVRAPDLNLLDCLWVSYGSMEINGQHVSGCIGYPPGLTRRENIILAGHDPVALDYYACRSILLPLGGANAHNHDPDHNERWRSVYAQAQETLNAAGGIRGFRAQSGDANIQVIRAQAENPDAIAVWNEHHTRRS